jgi:uncharacterized delta-60 repeat protein
VITRRGRWIVLGVPLAAAVVLAGSSASALTHSGAVDPSFGDNGVLTGQGDPVEALAIQPDGKIVSAGEDGFDREDGSSSLAVYRYNIDGSRDTSFGRDGAAQSIAWTGWRQVAWGIALQPDGKIVVAGTDSGVFMVVRYNADGSLDKSFGTNGQVDTTIGRVRLF